MSTVYQPARKMKCYSIYLCFLALALWFPVSKSAETRKDWPSSVRFYGVERDFAGLSVSMSASYAAIGAPAGRIFGQPFAHNKVVNGNRNGYVVVWRRPVANEDDWDWDRVHSANLTASGGPPDRLTELPFSDLFGTTLVINEPAGFIFVSSPRAVVGVANESQPGVVFAYSLSNETSGSDIPKLGLQCRLSLSDVLPSGLLPRNDSVDSFGFALSSSGRFLVASAPGMVFYNGTHQFTYTWIWMRNESGSPQECPWELYQTIAHPENHGPWNSQFGYSLSIKDLQTTAVLAIGARYAPITPANSSHELLPAGVVHVYRWHVENNTFHHDQTLSGPHGQWRTALGSSVDLSDNATLLVTGAVEDGPNVPNAGKGRAFLYVLNGTHGYHRVAEMRDDHGYKRDYFGTAVRFEHRPTDGRCRIAVGSLQTWRTEFNPVQLNGRGAVFVFGCDAIPPDGQLPLLWDVDSSSSKNNGEFGSAIAYDPTSLFIGAPSAPLFVRINIRNVTEVPDCGQMWVFDVKRQASLPVWTIVLISITGVLIAGFLVVSVICLIRKRRRNMQYARLN